jgi:Trp operon repressor
MAQSGETGNDELVLLLKHLVAIELWRGGLSQAQIKTRLGIGSEAITRMLKDVSREVVVRTKGGD